MLQSSTIAQLMKHGNVQKVLGGKEYIGESDPAEFYKKLQFYVDSKEKATGEKDKETAKKPVMDLEFWPLIKVVRLYVKASALSTGAVIVDLPGVHDSNAARAAVAEGYMKQCTGLWIVAPITRAVDDKAAKSLLGETFKRQLKMDGSFNTVTFICSKTDDISLLEAQESLGLEEEMGALWAKSDVFEANRRENKRRLDELKETKAEYTTVADEVDEQIELWDTLRDDVEDGRKVFPPTPKKRKRGSNSNASGTPSKRARSSDSDADGDYVDLSRDDEEDESQTQERNPLTLEEVDAKLSELKATKKEGRRHRQEIEAEIKHVRKQIAEIDEAVAKLRAEMSVIAISGRNQYSRGAIQQDFAAGIRELDQELAEETDASNFNPEVDARDYDEVARSLPVFCVSSRAYQKLQGRFQKEAAVPGFQNIEETEIPQLQAHCKKLTEASREANSRRFLNSLDQVLNSIRLTFSPDDAHASDTTKVLRSVIVDSKYEVLERELNEHFDGIVRQIAGEIEENIADVADIGINSAIQKSLDSVSRWGAPVDRLNRAAGGYFWATYKAICRRDGVYANAQGEHDWNAELLQPVMKVISPGWEKTFSRRVGTILHKAGSDAARLLQAFHSGLHQEMTRNSCSLGSFHMLSQQLAVYQELLKNLCNENATKIATESKDINRMFQPVVAKSLETAYSTCTAESGPGSFMRMKQAMLSFVTDARMSMFKDSVDTVLDALEAFLRSIEKNFSLETGEILISLKRDYQSAVGGSQSVAASGPAVDRVLELISTAEASFRQLVNPEKAENHAKKEFPYHGEFVIMEDEQRSSVLSEEAEVALKSTPAVDNTTVPSVKTESETGTGSTVDHGLPLEFDQELVNYDA